MHSLHWVNQGPGPSLYRATSNNLCSRQPSICSLSLDKIQYNYWYPHLFYVLTCLLTSKKGKNIFLCPHLPFSFYLSSCYGFRLSATFFPKPCTYFHVSQMARVRFFYRAGFKPMPVVLHQSGTFARMLYRLSYNCN